MVYELYSMAGGIHLRLKTLVPDEDNPVAPTVSDMWPTADWHEREVYDMMGIRFDGHPDLRRILMWDGYPFFPLRKDFPLEGKPKRGCRSGIYRRGATGRRTVCHGSYRWHHAGARTPRAPGRRRSPARQIHCRALIADPQGLAELIARLIPLSRIALDTEADSLHSYFEKLCLIQISTEHENMLVDPLAGFSLQPLYEALAGSGSSSMVRTTICACSTAAGQFAAKDIFDTMIAARLCGYQELGLAALVARHFGVKLSKASQKANWALRPLSNQMIEYAINDTKYLLPARANSRGGALALEPLGLVLRIV